MSKRHDIGIVGLGVMGSNLLLNMADHDISVVGYDKEKKKARTCDSLKDLVAALDKSRRILLLVPAGDAVDSVLDELEPLLSPGDIVADGGNSHYPDTDRRREQLSKKGIHYLGIGISGGEKGAREGPSLMPGGPRDAYDQLSSILEKIAARVDDEPCVAYLGPGSVGHYVKMVHNGIEYGLMQLIAETYDVMKRGLAMSDEELGKTYDEWNGGALQSYLMEITAKIFERKDGLINRIRGVAHQHGTGTWTMQEAVELHVPVPTIDVAVTMRNFSELEAERERAGRFWNGPSGDHGDRKMVLQELNQALLAANILTYIQGFALLRAGSDKHSYKLNLNDVVRVWRGGCIIRSEVLERFRDANVFLEPGIAKEVSDAQESLRSIVCTAAAWGIPVPALASALAYYDSYRSAWWPTNLIQAQRDFFGGHGYERVDAKGTFHTEWEKG